MFGSAPVGTTILRIRGLVSSPTYKFPNKSIASPKAKLNPALLPTPSAEPAVELPASVVTTPADVILRILLSSVAYRFPEESIVIPQS